MKPGYKQTEVGVIPEEWELRRFSELGKLTKGKGLLKEDIKRTGSIPAIPYTALYTDFSEVLDYSLIKWFVDDETQTVIVREPCLLFASSSNMEANTGKASAIVGTAPVAIGREVIIFKTSADCKFLSYLLSTAIYRRRTLSLARGTTIKHVYPATFQSYLVAQPPLPEQHAIAEALSDVDGLLGGLDRLIAKKRDLKQAAMQQLLTGQTRLPGFHGEWEIAPLGKCLASRPSYGINAPAVPYSDRLPVYIRITDISEDGRFTPDGKMSVKSELSANYYLSDGDIVFARTGASVGKSYQYNPSDGPLVFAGFLIRIRPETQKLLPAFVAAYVATGNYWRWVRLMSMRSGQPGINGNEYSQLPIPCPPLPEQTAIATILSDMDAELIALEQRREKTLALKQAMMQELLTGRTRLV